VKIVLKNNTEKREIELKFEHFQNHLSDGLKYTKCTLTIPNESFKAIGFGVCSKKDQFKKSKGRKEALRRALTTSGFNKAERTEIWKQYFEHAKK
jgi:hypothetical protein